MLKYGTTRFQPHHINAVLVETWEAFTISSGNIVRNSFAETHIFPLSPPNMIINTQACVASVQTSSKGINHIAADTILPIKLQVTSTNDPMVLIRSKGGTQQPLRTILLWAAAYDTVQNQTFLPHQEMKRETIMILKYKKVKLEN